VPVKIEYELSGQRHAAVLETITPGPLRHEFDVVLGAVREGAVLAREIRQRMGGQAS